MTIHRRGEAIARTETHQRVHRGLGYVPQMENVFGDLTVSENLRLGGYLLSPTERRRRKKVHVLFPFLGSRGSTLGGHLSGGERRMLSIASCLVANPRLVFLEEPSADLAPAIDVVFGKILEINHQLRIPILLVEQNVRRALALAQRVYILARGRNRLEAVNGPLTEHRWGDLFLEAGSLPEEVREGMTP